MVSKLMVQLGSNGSCSLRIKWDDISPFISYSSNVQDLVVLIVLPNNLVDTWCIILDHVEKILFIHVKNSHIKKSA